MVDTPELKKLIDSSLLKKQGICDELGISFNSLKNKCNNVTEFTAEEMFKLSDILKLSPKKMRDVFFIHVSNRG